MPHYRQRVCVYVFEAEGAGQGGSLVSGWSVERGVIDPFWQNHVNVKHKRDKEALFTIWSLFSS